MIENFGGFIWFCALLAALTLLQRRLHLEIQAVLLLITRNANLTFGLFSILFLPGVFLHESSHYLMAKLLRVQTGRFSILPKPLPNGRLQLGYVETHQTDFFRDALIGVAPLITGCTFIALIGFNVLQLPILWEAVNSQDLNTFWSAIGFVLAKSDFWLWFYLIFTVSSMMFPSNTDQRAWIPVLIFMAGVLVAAFLLGAGPWILDTVSPWINDGFMKISVILGISVAIHVVLLAPVWIMRVILSGWTRMTVNF